MTAVWLPAEGSIVARGNASGPTQDEELFESLQGALEDARGEFRLSRLDASEAILLTIILSSDSLQDDRYKLLSAAAHSLIGRIHWRRAERGLEYRDEALAEEERAKEGRAFRKAISLFDRYEHAITADMSQCCLFTDYAIALFRTKNTEAAIWKLQRAKATGVLSVDGFTCLGMTYRERGDYARATSALKKGLQLAPSDKLLLETLAGTLDDAGKSKEAIRAYCRAAVAAGKDKDLLGAERLLRNALKIKQDDARALIMLTLLLRSQKNEFAAKGLLDDLLDKVPANPLALGLRATILRDLGNFDAALSDFSSARAETADLAWVSLEYAKTLGARDLPTAHKLLNQAAQFLGEDDERVVLARVHLHVQNAISNGSGTGPALEWLYTASDESPTVRGLIDQVGPTLLLDRLAELRRSESQQVGLLREMVNHWPDRVEPRVALAGLLLRRGSYAEAIVEADVALAIGTESPNVLGLKAKALEARGDLAGAVRFYRRASRATRGDDQVFSELVGALIRAGRAEEALSEVEHRLALFPKNGLSLLEKGRLLFGAGEFSDAADALRDAEALVPGHALLALRLQLGDALRSLDQYGEALDVFERGIQVENEHCDARAHMAATLIEVAEYDRAAELLEWAISKISADAADDRAKARLGWLWDARGWALRCACRTPVEQLKAMFERATLFAPSDPFAKENLAWALLREEHNRANGKRLIQEMIDEYAWMNDLVGRCYFMLGQDEVSEQWFRIAVSNQPTSIDTRFDLGLALLAMSRYDEAEKEYGTGSRLARKRAAEPRRGLFYVAIIKLVAAATERRVDGARANSICQGLRKNLVASGQRGRALPMIQL